MNVQGVVPKHAKINPPLSVFLLRYSSISFSSPFFARTCFKEIVEKKLVEKIEPTKWVENDPKIPRKCCLIKRAADTGTSFCLDTYFENYVNVDEDKSHTEKQ